MKQRKANMLINIVLFAVLAVMAVRMLILSKRNKKNKELIDVVNAIFDETVFFEKADHMIGTIDDPEFESKARVIKLWGSVYYKHFDQFEEILADIDIEPLFIKKNNKESIDLNEDSFFYLCLAIPNLLNKTGKNNLRAALLKKLEPYNERLSGQLVKGIGDACTMFYDKKEDCGEAFFQKIMEGDYGEYIYSKQMITLYKMICNAMLAKLYLIHGNAEAYEECEPMLKKFAAMGVGKRWIDSIDLEVKLEEEEVQDETFEIDAPKDEAEEVEEVIEEGEKKAEEEK
jgi:hypothetical protein